MTFTDRNFTSTDFTAQKQQISEEGIFPLTFVGLTFHPERIFEENGEEKPAEAAAAQGLGQLHALRLGCGLGRVRITVAAQAQLRRLADHGQRGRQSQQQDGQREPLHGDLPALLLQQPARKQRRGERADAGAGRGQAGGTAAQPYEPALHGHQGRYVDQAHAAAHEQAKNHEQLRQRASLTG